MPGFLRAALERALWTRRRAALAGAAVLLALAAAVAAAAAAPHGGPRAGAPPTAAAARPRPAAARPAAAAPAAPRAAVAAAEGFAAAWADPAPGWLARVRPLATPRLAAQLAAAGNALLPVTRVTGAALVTGQAAATVDLSVPTDAGPALVTVRYAAGAWRADSVMLAREGS